MPHENWLQIAERLEAEIARDPELRHAHISRAVRILRARLWPDGGGHGVPHLLRMIRVHRSLREDRDLVVPAPDLLPVSCLEIVTVIRRLDPAAGREALKSLLRGATLAQLREMLAALRRRRGDEGFDLPLLDETVGWLARDEGAPGAEGSGNPELAFGVEPSARLYADLVCRSTAADGRVVYIGVECKSMPENARRLVKTVANEVVVGSSFYDIYWMTTDDEALARKVAGELDFLAVGNAGVTLLDDDDGEARRAKVIRRPAGVPAPVPDRRGRIRDALERLRWRPLRA